MSILTTARRIARHRSATPAELREENRLLLARAVAADDFFTLLVQDRDQVYAAWEQSQQRAADAELVVVCQQADIDSLAAEVTRLRAELANLAAVDVAAGERDTSAMEDQATTPVGIDVKPLWEALGIGPILVA
ncbi:hypothetical protein [Streptomyces sp900116325]|uniref:hypothetical protein n=1 Tax=Streptomyces sp. 900116325 TaxID=3154295 RepID=UPI00331D4FB9